MKTIKLIFSDVFLTTFMQHADVFEKFKVVVKDTVFATVVPNWGEQHLSRILEKAKEEKTYKLIAVLDEENVFYQDPDVKVISTGSHWSLFEDYIRYVQSLQALSTFEEPFNFLSDNHECVT